MQSVLDQLRELAMNGVGRLNAEATIGRRMDAAELAEFRKAQTVRQLQLAQKKAQGPMSTADRVAKHVASRNEIGEIPPVRHPRLKAKCKYDLAAFLWYYCRPILSHKPSADLKAGLIADVEKCILWGGQVAELFGRGGGKTTVVDFGAATWALLYGHRRFPVDIGASLKLAKRNLKVVRRLIERSPEIAADFPAVALPVRALGGIAQRAASQTYRGEPTGIEWGADQIILPMLRDENGNPLDAGCGGILAATGIGGAIRGSNEGGRRPDMLLIDDPQTRKIAASPKAVEGVIDYIHSDALGLAGHDTTIACFLTITPQRFGDVATEISSQAKHPEWDVRVQPFIKRLPPNWDQLCELFVAKYAEDMAAKEYNLPRSTAWYDENRELFAELETIDPLQFDERRERDVTHHMLNLRAKMGKRAFDAEMMMHVADAASTIQINPDIVAAALNGAPQDVCPPGTDTVIGFFDVNIQQGAGLSGVLVAFGPNRVAAGIDYIRIPSDGSPLVPPNSSDYVRNRRVAAAIREAVQWASTRRIRDTKGRAVRIRALGFDRGWLPDVVHRTLYVIRKRVPLGFPVVAVRGFPWNKFGTRKTDILRRGDHIFATRSKFGEYLAMMAPYWREVMQGGFLETPLFPGSFSLWGKDAAVHYRVAQEICANKLVRKYQVYSGRETTTAWDWMSTGPDHFGDAFTNAFALASWYRAYDALSSTIDASALGVREAHQDDLFDPRQNPAIYDGAADETEGTLDTGTPRHPSEEDLETAIEEGRARDPLNPLPNVRRIGTKPKAKLKIRKFKKGRWTK